jgi:hypothetical protein
MKNGSIEESSSMFNNSFLIEKLKPSNKNRLITKKYKILAQNSTATQNDEFKNLGINEQLHSSITNNNNDEFQLKWNNIVKQAKVEAMHLDINASEVFNINKDDHSIFSENLEDINNLIEETYQIVLNENMFLRQEHHSIMPFLLLTSKGIHRMCLSDYEIKMVYRMFTKKLKYRRIDGMDYYKIGLINFYKGKYYMAYNNFRTAFEMRKNEVTIRKWLAFCIIILLFTNDNKLKITNIIDDSNVIKTEKDDEGFFFSCCTHRKNNIKFGSKTSDTLFLTDGSIQQNKHYLCKELEELLKLITLDEKHENEGWYILLIQVDEYDCWSICQT